MTTPDVYCLANLTFDRTANQRVPILQRREVPMKKLALTLACLTILALLAGGCEQQSDPVSP